MSVASGVGFTPGKGAAEELVSGQVDPVNGGVVGRMASPARRKQLVAVLQQAQSMGLPASSMGKGAAEVGMHPTSDKPFKPLDASQPAAPGQRAKEQECSCPSTHPSASPAPPSNKPAEGKHTATKQDPVKTAAFKRAEIYSILYKYAHERSFQIKKAALKSSIRQVGLDAVIGAINAGCDK